ncbi:MAG: DUF1573 domain-containing protein [Flavobacteriales bacterium]|jgi:hypothetical protein|nr:DUF1573 domain-containing protein [Flavobacteriales bacterium]
MVFYETIKLQRLIVGAFFILSSLICHSQAKIKFEQKTQNFGKTKPGDLIEFDYVFSNNGNQPLIVKNIEVSCSCTKYVFPVQPIATKEKDTIRVTFDTNHKIGYQDRILLVYSNAENSPTKIRFKGMVDHKSEK